MDKKYCQRMEILISKILGGESLTPDDKQVLVFILTYIKDQLIPKGMLR